MRTVFIKTFGCKVNYTESVSLADMLRGAGIACAELTGAKLPGADTEPVVFVNTCCVTQEAERKAGQFIRRMRRDYPRAEVLFCGCGARQDGSQQLYQREGVRVFNYYPEAFEWLKEHCASPSGTGGSPVSHAGGDGTPPLPRRARAFIKVQDGCFNCCGYCIVPFVRRYASRPLAEIITEAERRLTDGYHELVLTGINIGHYGQEPVLSLEEASARTEPRARLYQPIPGHPTFFDLVDELLALLPEGTRLRISSIEPEDLSSRFFEQLVHPRMCPHLHLPLQSGSEAVLKAMRRRYSITEYVALAAKFRAACPDGALSTDIISGFPTETEADIEATLTLVSELGFERVHGFPFSPRPNTPAGELSQLPRRERQARNRRLIEHAQGVADERWQRFLGAEVAVLIEERSGDGWVGHGPAYQVVHFKGDLRPGQMVLVVLTAYQAGEFSGRVVS